MFAIILISTALLLFIAYRYYGRFLDRITKIDDRNDTPAVSVNDGIDYVPTRASVVFGHHFSSIAGAGPIVGPIVAAAAFGWAPTWLWVVLGSIFIGGVHDFGSTVISLRYGGKSIVEAFRRIIGQRTGKLLLLFVLLTLIYVIIVFLDLTAASFTEMPAVATASGWFVLMALAFGWVITKSRMHYGTAIAVFVVLTYLGLALGHFFPAPVMSKDFWIVVVLIYCMVAAVMPVSVLMQPRDFLSATFLYAILALGLLGAIVGPKPFDMPAFKAFHSENLGMLVPFLFITVACGACSGFHCMVASGTTSKQLRRETDVRKVAYGGMLVEGILATLAIGCIAVSGGMKSSPIDTFAGGAAIFFSSLGIPTKLGTEFATLAVSTFLLTTLDTCTRLARFLIEELFGWSGTLSRYASTLFIGLVAGYLTFQKFTDLSGNLVPAWLALWPLFGATNQLLAALALTTFTVFLKSRGISYIFAAIPAAIMIAMPMSGLAIMVASPDLDAMLRIAAALQLVMAVFIIGMSIKFLVKTAEPELRAE